jgi:hypothetical protein
MAGSINIIYNYTESLVKDRNAGLVRLDTKSTVLIAPESVDTSESRRSAGLKVMSKSLAKAQNNSKVALVTSHLSISLE